MRSFWRVLSISREEGDEGFASCIGVGVMGYALLVLAFSRPLRFAALLSHVSFLLQSRKLLHRKSH